MPLDLEEDAYHLVGDSLNQELSRLDQNGWNTQRTIRKSAVIRWSMITSTIREDVLEVLLGCDVSNVPQRIRYVDSSIFTFSARANIAIATSDPKSMTRGTIFPVFSHYQIGNCGREGVLVMKSTSSIRFGCFISKQPF
jgi:hypothetical protein